jgi:hypothetical protein
VLRPALVALDQIRVGDVGRAEGDEVGAAVKQRGLGPLAVIAAIGDIGTAEAALECGKVEIGVAPLADVEVGEAVARQRLGSVAEGAGGIAGVPCRG